MKRIYRTMQGREIDMDQLVTRNETMPAVGNVRVNARGDELGPDGKIVKTRESILAEYYDNNPGMVSDEEISLHKVKIESSRTSFAQSESSEPQLAKTKSKDIK